MSSEAAATEKCARLAADEPGGMSFGRSVRVQLVPFLVIGILAILSFSVHLWPLSFSQYPFNQDSLYEAKVAERILDSGRIAVPWESSGVETHGQTTPAYNVLIAYVSASIGASPYFVVQPVVAVAAVLLVLTVYTMLFSMRSDVRGALAGAFFVCMFGTLVYVTASGWKMSLGVSLWAFLVYAYSQRARPWMRLLVACLMVVIPLVHHLTAIVSYGTIAFLLGWSYVYATIYRKSKRGHHQELTLLVVLGAAALAYYYLASFDRLQYIASASGALFLVLTGLLFFMLSTVVLFKETRSKRTFAFVPAATIVIVSVIDYHGLLFSYVPSVSFSKYLLLAAGSAFMVFLGWYGLESALRSRSIYRAIPMGTLLPPLVLICFALLSPSVEQKHQFVYRTFDLADLAIGLGIGVSFFTVFASSRNRKRAILLTVAFVLILVSTLPYGLYTEEFTGVRHDSQAYEIDMICWLEHASRKDRPEVCTDERLSYMLWALCNLGGNNSLPSMLQANRSLAPYVFYVYEEFWSSSGVSVYPYGVFRPSREYMETLLEVENTWYVGGPQENQLVVMTYSWIGETRNNWLPR